VKQSAEKSHEVWGGQRGNPNPRADGLGGGGKPRKTEKKNDETHFSRENTKKGGIESFKSRGFTKSKRKDGRKEASEIPSNRKKTAPASDL